jgi:hypothetical protein
LFDFDEGAAICDKLGSLIDQYHLFSLLKVIGARSDSKGEIGYASGGHRP